MAAFIDSSSSIRVLLLEQTDEGARLLHDLLANANTTRFAIERVTTIEEAFSVVVERAPDVLLISLSAIDPVATETIASVRRLAPDCPIVALTTCDNPGSDRRAMAAGAHGYLVTNELTSRHLDRELHQAIERCRLVREIDAARREAQQLAACDSLTGLANRLYLMKALDQALASARRTGTGVGLLVIDLDRFKQINDVYGHLRGDEVLRCVARRLRAAVRESDSVARLGGDEFVVVLTNLHRAEDCARVAQKLLDAVSERIVLAGREHRVKASIGISVTMAGATRATDLLREADTSMFHAKRSGTGRFEFYSVEMTTQAVERMRIEGRLRGIAERRELFLEYQPLVDLGTGRIVGLEALLRWRASPNEIVPPIKFIPVAEEMGEIVPIGAWVLNQACRDIATLRRTVDPRLYVSANVSSRQLKDHSFPELLRNAASHASLPPAALVLEITESTIVDGSEQTTASIQAARSAGFAIGIDDFGTGYSSLLELKQFPVSEIKIDRCFVSGLPDSEQDLMIVATIVSLARGLSAQTVAEGVETAEQFEAVRTLGCSHAQGYFISRPVAIEAVPGVVESWNQRVAGTIGKPQDDY